MVAIPVLASFLGFFSATPTTSGQSAFLTQVDPACERALPPRVVQSVSGRSGVELVPRDSRHGAHGTCNYTINGKDVILSVAINPLAKSEFYESYRRNCGYTEPSTPIAGLGDEALACSAYGGGADRAVVVHTGRVVVVVQSAKRFDPTTRRVRESYFTTEQLTDLAWAVVKKL
ncbi:MAG: hypothetical protein ACOYXR_00525 [Nitrospirota bacterium]